MSHCRNQALIEAPPERIWELVGDPRRHPEWWPRVIEVSGQSFEQGSDYAQITKSAIGTIQTRLQIDKLDDMREIGMSCNQTGMYARWLLTPAQGGTFVDVELGMNPVGLQNKMFDATLGQRYFRRWLEASLAGLDAAARQTSG